MRKATAIFHGGRGYDTLVFTRDLDSVGIYASDGEGLVDAEDVLVAVSEDDHVDLVSAADFLRSLTFEELRHCDWDFVDEDVVFWLKIGSQADETDCESGNDSKDLASPDELAEFIRKTQESWGDVDPASQLIF